MAYLQSKQIGRSPYIKHLTLYCITLFLFVFVAPNAYCKDLSGRLGIGYSNIYSNSRGSRDVPAFSLKYGATKDVHLQVDLGLHTQSPSVFTLGGKVYKNIFYEPALNFYAALSAAYLKELKSGVEILGLVGAEFFIPGIDSLGLLFEAGLSGCNITGDFLVKTVGFTFIQAGMHFYF